MSTSTFERTYGTGTTIGLDLSDLDRFYAALVAMMQDLVTLNDPRVDDILAKYEIELRAADGSPIFPRQG